jgi:hypothetical protein
MKRLPDPMTWLSHGVPLTLLIDLMGEGEPASTGIYQDEPSDLSWTRTRDAA